MGIINILDTQTANMIAAGEVVEKPASAVKELIENSIDAGATHIICEIRGGGNSFIRISDNGKGISGDDLPKAILPHATSKISNANDIDGILTLGFRGEALAAISSVSRLEILSKQKDSEIGHKLTSDENGVEVCEEGVPDGTVITVRDLFYNVPARRKFMRKDSSEASAIGAVITKASLSHPEISFKMISEGTVKFITPGDGDLYSAIYATLGKDFAKALTPVAGVHAGIIVGGYISKHGESRGSRSGQYFFVNGRPIQSTQIMAALEQAFRSYMPSKRFPAAVLKIEVPPKSIDVNVHPTKTEIKFADDRKIFEAIYSVVISALRDEETISTFGVEETQVTFTQGKKTEASPRHTPYDKNAMLSHLGNGADANRPVETVSPPITENLTNASTSEKTEEFTNATIEYISTKPKITDGELIFRDPLSASRTVKDVLSASQNKTNVFFVRTDIPKLGDTPGTKATVNSETASDNNKDSHTTADGASAVSNIDSHKTADGASAVLSQTTAEQQQIPLKLIAENSPQLVDMIEKELPKFKVIGEAFGGYIIAETETALLLIDKHAAHERILYEELVSQRTTAQSQMLISPYIVKPGIEASEMLLENKDLLMTYGFELDSFGDDSIAVRSIPATLTGVKDIQPLLDEFASSLSGGDRLPFNKRCDRALYTMACKAAIKLGPPSKNEELAVLVEKLLSDPKLRLCPHGRPIVKELPKREIEKFFDR